jgi:hypothetical protein
MNQKHLQILQHLDEKGAKQYCLIPGKNIVGHISALVNGKRLNVTITGTTFGYYAAVSYEGMVYSQWARKPSTAVMELGTYLKTKIF